MKILVVTLLLAVSATRLLAAAPLSYEERTAQLAAFYEKVLPKLPEGTIKVVDQSYVDNEVRGFSPDSSQKLDLFVPAGPGPFPLLVNIHGGGWHSGGKEGGVALAMAYLPKGIAVASLTYRLVKDAAFPAQIEDCNAAIAWLRAHAEQYHLNPDKIAVTGHSAGAHLCALIAATGDKAVFKDPQKVQAAVCASGIFDMDRERGQWPKKNFLWNERDPMFPFFPNKTYDADFARYASPQSYIHAGMPPMYIVHGDSDTVVPFGQAQVFAEDLQKAGVEVTWRAAVGRDHGNVMDDAAKAETTAFIEKHLK
jgi:acetyl esterase/lipase